MAGTEHGRLRASHADRDHTVAGLPLAGLLMLAGAGSAFVSLFLLRTQLGGSRRDGRRRSAASRAGR